MFYYTLLTFRARTLLSTFCAILFVGAAYKLPLRIHVTLKLHIEDYKEVALTCLFLTNTTANAINVLVTVSD